MQHVEWGTPAALRRAGTPAGVRPWLAALLALGVLPAGARATDVVVRVGGVVGTAGSVRVSVCLPAEYRRFDCRLKAHAPAHPGDVAVTVRDVPPGRYAVIVHHDRSNDSVVHTNWLGVPTDGVGVSRDAQGFLSAPGFDRVAVDIAGPRVELGVTLRLEPQR